VILYLSKNGQNNNNSLKLFGGLEMNRKFIWCLGLLALTIFCVSVYAQDWPGHHGNFQRTGTAPVSIDPATLTLDWTFLPADAEPFGTFTSSPIIAFGNVYYGYLTNVFEEKLVCLDASDGSFKWEREIRAAGGGIGFLQSPLAATRTLADFVDSILCDTFTTLVTDSIPCDTFYTCFYLPGCVNPPFPPCTCITVDTMCCIDSITCDTFTHVQIDSIVCDTFVSGVHTDSVIYVGGTIRRFLCINANDGAIIWNKLLPLGTAGIQYSSPVLYRVGGNDSLVIFHDHGSLATTRKVHALRVRTGSVEIAGTAWSTVNLSGRPYMNMAMSNDTVFVGTRARVGATILNPDSSGDIYAIKAGTGAILASQHFPGYGFQCGLSIIGNHIVTVLRNYTDADNLVTAWDSHDITTAPRQILRGSINNLSTLEVFKDPTSISETLMVYGIIGNLVVGRKFAGPSTSISTRVVIPTVGPVEATGAIARENGLLVQGDDAGYLYVYDATGATGGLHYWHKVLASPILAGPAISADDDTLVVVLELNGQAFGYRNGHVASRPRVETEFDESPYLPVTEVLMNIINFVDPVLGTGGFDDTTLNVFENVGDQQLTYQLEAVSSALQLSAKDFASITYSRTRPTRAGKAARFADENTLISGNAFLGKKYVDVLKKAPLEQMDFMEEEGITSIKEMRGLVKKASYGSSKLEEAKATASVSGWLTYDDNNNGVAAAGGNIEMHLAANNPGGYGEYFAEIKLFNTNEPDAESYLDTTRMLVHLIVGFVGEIADMFAGNNADPFYTGLTKSNYGTEGGFRPATTGHANWYWGAKLGPFQDSYGAFGLGNSATTYAGVNIDFTENATAEQVNFQFRPETTFTVESRSVVTEGSWTDAVDHTWSQTKYSHQNGLPLLIRQYSWGIQSDLTTYSGEAIFQTYVITNTGPDPVTDIEIAPNADMDVGGNPANNEAVSDSFHDVVYEYNPGDDPDFKCGMFRIPGDNVNSAGSDVLTGWSTRNVPGHNVEWYATPGVKPDSMHKVFVEKRKVPTAGVPTDYWVVNGNKAFSLGAGESYTVTYVWFGADLATGGTLLDRYKDWCRIAGYFRGDVDGVHGGPSPTVADEVYLSNYVNHGGPKPKPFTGQGDVDGDGVIDAADVSYLDDYIFKGIWQQRIGGPGTAPAPIDRDRFIPDAFKNVRPGLTNDDNWLP
jgi:hypothetical protein